MASLGKIFLKKFLGLGVLLFPSLLQAMEITPFYTQNQSPLIQIFGLPSIGNFTVLPIADGNGLQPCMRLELRMGIL